MASEIARNMYSISAISATESKSDLDRAVETPPSPVGLQSTQLLVRANPISTAFGDIVSLLAKSPAHKHYSLADLEWLLLPPVAFGQFALGDAKLPNGQTVPAGFVLWAQVSPDVDARLSQAQHCPARLQPNEWRSGETFWIVAAVGYRNILQNLIDELARNVFGGKGFKILKPRMETAARAQQETPA